MTGQGPPVGHAMPPQADRGRAAAGPLGVCRGSGSAGAAAASAAAWMGASPWAGLAVLGGTAVQLTQAELVLKSAVHAWVLAVLAMVAAGLQLAVWSHRLHGTGPRGTHRGRHLADWPITLGLVACIALASWSLTEARAARQLARGLPAALEGRDIEVLGRVATLPSRSAEGQRFEFEVEQAWLDGRPVAVPPRLALGWYAPAAEAAAAGVLGPTTASAPRAGETWHLPVRLRRVHGLANPWGFDLELWLFERGVGASGSVRTAASATALRLADAPWGVQRLRQAVRDALDRRLGRTPAAGVVAALAIGDQSAIERPDWDVFRATGVAHLMSISGLHVTLFAWLAAALVQRFWCTSARACLACPAQVAGDVGGVLLATAYALLAGWGVPAQRTVLMLAVVAALRLAGLRWPWTMVWLAAVVAVALADPWALLQPGTWLSFVAVGLLMLGGAAARQDRCAPTLAARAWAAVAAGLRTQMLATLGLAPLSLLFFQQLSVVGFVANLVAIPFVSFVVTPLALLGMVVGAAWPLAAAGVEALLVVLQALAHSEVATWNAAAAPGWVGAVALLGSAVMAMRLPLAWRALGLVLAGPLLAWPADRPPSGRFDLLAVDIGQGTAVVLRTAAHTLLYDTGAAWGGANDAGARVLVPLLRALGERRLDALVLSHRDSDHTGGAASVWDALPVNEMASSLEPGHPLRQRSGARHRPCLAGRQWQWDGVRFEFLHPTEADLAPPWAAPRPNAVSCVLRVSAAQGSALLAGDIEAPQEAALVARHRGALASQVLIAPHHGSKTSSSAALLDAVAPQWVVVQAGYRNRFGHPAAEVLQRYRARGITVIQTSQCGAWRWNGAKMDSAMGPGDAFWCERERRRRYWHHRADPGP